MLSEKIVVVDDDPKIIKSLKMVLTEYEIVPFQDGRDAIQYISNPNSINLVLLDVMMPQIDGLSVLAEIKKINKNIAVLMMTAYGTKDVILQSLRNHADDFIEKPFKAEDLKIKIKDLLKEKLCFAKMTMTKEDRINRIKRFIQRNSSNVTLLSIANEMSLSPKYVSRMFNKGEVAGFRQYKVQVKMEKAKELLRTSPLNVCEISYELGYQNAESFMRIFKRITKMTPLEFRKKFRQKR